MIAANPLSAGAGRIGWRGLVRGSRICFRSAMDSITQTEMRAELKCQVDAAGGLMVWCRMRGVTHASVSLMMSGHRPISEAVANACGFIVETTYKQIRSAA